MAIKLLFEDSEKTPSSQLLRKTLHGNNIYFCNGCSNIIYKLKQILSPDDIVYIFYDLVPNNVNTKVRYTNLIQELKSKQDSYENVHVVPIVCIEYYVCKFLFKYGYMLGNGNSIEALIKALVADFDYRKVPDDILKIGKLKNSLEKMYKYILSNQKLICMHNEFKYDEKGESREKSIKGIFYERGCDCERKYCYVNSTDSLSLKAERLYTELPLFVVEKDEHRKLLESYGIHIKSIDNSAVKDQCQRLYDRICNSMNVNPIHIVM